jgi:hypothetical protein
MAASFATCGTWMLSRQRYLVGDTITNADVYLFTTLARFDAAYHGHFKCNRSKLTEMPVLWAYARDLFQTPGFGDTIDFDHMPLIIQDEEDSEATFRLAEGGRPQRPIRVVLVHGRETPWADLKGGTEFQVKTQRPFGSAAT